MSAHSIPDGTRQSPEYIAQWGGCPECGDNDGYVDIGKSHWFLCRAHKAMWFAGANLFSSWHGETEAEQRARYDELGLDDYRDVIPVHAAA
jgi:hypothetical protein